MNRQIAAVITSVALAACGGSKKDPLPGRGIHLTTYQAASLAIGQPNLTTVNAPTCGADGLDTPYGAPAWDGTRLFVSDTFGNRVHAYTGLPTASGAIPGFDLGQGDCAGPGDPTSASELYWPQSVRVAGSGASAKLVVTDSTNNRVLVFSTIPTAAPASASAAVGQADLTTWDPACTASSLDTPQSAFVTPGGKLIVADQGNSRVLIWNTLPTASGTSADLVLGQAALDTCAANDDPMASLGDVTAATLNGPADVWSDGIRLVVADSGNNRVLVWKNFPTVNGAPADAVVGQGSFAASGSGLSASTLALPLAVASDGTHLFIADAGNHRVLTFDAIPSTGAGASATVVLGQPNLTSGSENAAGLTTGASLSNPAGLAIIDGAIFVADSGNHRVLVFRPAVP